MRLATLVAICVATSAYAADYVVDDSLSALELSIKLYGTPDRAKEISQANPKTTAKFSKGQHIQIPAPASVSADEGSEKLLDYWRKRLSLRNTDVSASERAELVRRKYDVEVERIRKTEPGALPSANVQRSASLYQEGEVFYSKKKYADALAKLAESRVLDPQNSQSAILELRVLTDADRLEDAYVAADKLVRDHPEFAAIKPVTAIRARKGEIDERKRKRLEAEEKARQAKLAEEAKIRAEEDRKREVLRKKQEEEDRIKEEAERKKEEEEERLEAEAQRKRIEEIRKKREAEDQ